MKIIFYSILTFFAFSYSYSQTRTVGLTVSTKDQSGSYVLFTPLKSTETYLMDNCGRQVRSWSSAYYPGVACIMRPDGGILRTGSPGNTYFGAGQGGIIEWFDWNYTKKWSYTINDSMNNLHHDIKQLPNGNILAIVWESHKKSDAVANGRNPIGANLPVWSERIIEIEPIGKDSAKIVWQWKAWDHMVQDFSNTKPNYKVVKEHPELININYYDPAAPRDWFHFNGIDYNAKLDQIVLSAHNLNEIYIIDHSTTTAEAKTHSGGNSGKGGDILYRWGNAAAYGRGTEADMKLFNQHHAHWIPDSLPNGGKIMVFNNGQNRPGSSMYSTIDIIDPPMDDVGNYLIDATKPFGPDTAIIAYKAPVKTDFYSANISGAYTLPNGNIFITSGQSGRLFEVNANKDILWQYINPDAGAILYQPGETPAGNQVFRAEPYPASFEGFKGKKMTPSSEIEANPLPQSICVKTVVNDIAEVVATKPRAYPNPANDRLILNGSQSAILCDVNGRILSRSFANADLMVGNLSNGIYLLQMTTTKGLYTEKILVQH